MLVTGIFSFYRNVCFLFVSVRVWFFFFFFLGGGGLQNLICHGSFNWGREGYVVKGLFNTKTIGLIIIEEFPELFFVWDPPFNDQKMFCHLISSKKILCSIPALKCPFSETLQSTIYAQVSKKRPW